MTFTYTPAEESAWLALKPMLSTAQGQLNPDLAREYIRAAIVRYEYGLQRSVVGVDRAVEKTSGVHSGRVARVVSSLLRNGVGAANAHANGAIPVGAHLDSTLWL